MLKSPQAPTYRLPVVCLLALVLGGLFLFAIVAAPPATQATHGVPQKSRSESGKRLRPEYVPGHVLVRYKDEPTAKGVQKSMTSLSLKDRSIPIKIERLDQGQMVAGLRLAHVDAADTMEAIQALKQRGDVLYAEPDYIMHADLTPNDPQFGSQSGMAKIAAPTAWNTNTGSSNVVIGVIDEGIDINHPDLAANKWVNPSPGSIPGFTGDINGWDFFHNDATVFDNTGTYLIPCNPGPPPGGNNCDETDAHATHVAGIAGAVGNNSVGVAGVNWTVKLMSLKFLGPGGGASSDALRAMGYAKAQRDLFISSGGAQGANVRVLNNSYGGGGFTQAFLDGLNAINQSGILFVASAGNEGGTIFENNDVTPQYPASYKAPNVISVAWTNSFDDLASGSSFGAQSVALGAPGSSILSTTPTNTYDSFSGTSMASPHVAGSAALLLAQNPNLTVAQLKSLLLFNGDVLASLNGKTLTGRRLNIGNSFAALLANDTTPPGAVTNFHINSQTGRSFDLGWTASGDDLDSGPAASLYQLSFTDAVTGAVVQLRNIIPATPGTPQTFVTKVPYGHTNGTITLREFDNVGNEGTPVSLNVAISFIDGNPYASAVGKAVALSTGGTHLNFNCDDCYRNSVLPFPFPFFGQNYNSVTVSSNGNIYFTPPSPPVRTDPDENADDVPSSVGDLTNFKMISGLWDDLYLKTSQRADADVYVVQPDANRIIFRWQGVPCNAGPTGSCTFGGAPINFEIELRSNGLIQTRYGSGNTNIFPVVGISNGEPDPYVIPFDTSEEVAINLTNAQQVTYIPRAAMNPLDFDDFFVSQHYRDFLAREPDPGGEAFWIDQMGPCANGDQNCINTRRINVSNAFFFELEYQQTGSYVYRMYRAAFGNSQPFPNPDGSNPTEANKIPLYTKFKADREQVIGGASLPAQQQAFANLFVQRTEFTNKYSPGLSLDQFVDAILLTIKNDVGVDLTSQKSALVALGTRGAVVYRLANDDLQGGNGGINNRAFIDAEYNRAFVFGEYSGYLLRDADIGGFLFWKGQVDSGPLRDTTKQRAMVCSFIDSAEYQFRFSTIESHHTSECN